MKIKSVLTSLDGVDAALHAAYTEKDGVFILNLEGAAEHPDVKTLQAAVTAARADKSKAEKELRDVKKKYENVPDDFDPELYHSAVDGGKDINKQLTAQRERLTTEKTNAVKAVQDKLDATTARLTKIVGEAELTKALQESNVTPELTGAARRMFLSDIKVDYEGDEPVVTLGGLPVASKVKEWAATDEGKHFVKAPENSGGGSRTPNGPTNNGTDYSKMTNTELMTLNAKPGGDAKAEAEMARRNAEPIPQGKQRA